MTPGRARWIYFAAALLVVGGGLAYTAVLDLSGFPLDDAWIHQTYARNLARTGQLAFHPGEPSTGSTGPLWSVVMAVGQLLRLPPVLWSAAVGALTLTAMAEIGRRAIATVVPDRPRWAFWGGLLLVFEWHMVWAALSGMETLLIAALSLAVFAGLLADSPGSLRAGFLIGVGVWLRPDAVVLLLPAALVFFFGAEDLRSGTAELLRLAAAALAPVLPYLLMNLSLSGEVWPATFFAKQAEYAAVRGLPLGERLLAQALVPLVGAGIAVLPWAVYAVFRAVRERRWAVPAGFAWALAMIGLYALRLPVTYQHGRYLMPVIPVFTVIGVIGMAQGVRRIAHSQISGRSHTDVQWGRVLGRTGVLLVPILTLVFLVFGLRAYARDVGVIETEMVAAARWIAAETAPDALIAAHDIGALGYFGGREIIDLAGLVSPQAVPILRDEAALADLLDARGADYLVTLEGWYPQLEDGLVVVFRTNAAISPGLGGANMVVYLWGGDG